MRNDLRMTVSAAAVNPPTQKMKPLTETINTNLIDFMLIECSAFKIQQLHINLCLFFFIFIFSATLWFLLATWLVLVQMI